MTPVRYNQIRVFGPMARTLLPSLLLSLFAWSTRGRREERCHGQAEEARWDIPEYLRQLIRGKCLALHQFEDYQRMQEYLAAKSLCALGPRRVSLR